MNFKVQKSECSVSEPLFVYSCACAFLCLGGGGGGVPDPKKFSEPRSGEEKFFLPSRGSRGMLPQKSFKKQGPRLAKMHFLRFQLGKTR